MSRRYRQRDYKVTETQLNESYGAVIRDVNRLDGPKVEYDLDRGCMGLRADRNYVTGELVTTYGGRHSTNEMYGDYVAKASEIHIDGAYDFLLSQKGRWINESDRDRTIVIDLGQPGLGQRRFYFW